MGSQRPADAGAGVTSSFPRISARAVSLDFL